MIQTVKPRTTTRMLVRKMHRDRVAAPERALETRRLAQDIRALANWVAVFDSEYDLPTEVVSKFRERLETMGERLARI